MRFEAEFEISNGDCKEIVNYHFYGRPLQLVLNIVRLEFGIVAGICAILKALLGDRVWAASFGAVCLMIFGLFILAPRRTVSSLRKTPFYQGKIHIVADDSGTHFIYKTGDSNTQWSGYVRFRETKHLFLLFVSD